MHDDTTDNVNNTDSADVPTKATSRKRTPPISWRPPADQRAKLEAQIAASGLSTNAYITEAVFGRTRHRPAEIQRNAQILAACARLSDDFRDVARSTEQTDVVAAIESARRDLAEIRSALFLAMGRKP